MSKPRLVEDAKAELALAALRPSEYTAALIQVLHARADSVRGAKVLEIGSGSGVVLAALGELGAASLCGIDIEEDAVESGMAMGAKSMPSESSGISKVKRWAPVFTSVPTRPNSRPRNTIAIALVIEPLASTTAATRPRAISEQ